MAAIGFTLQIYFDFSGYTDMALGIARFFGIRLPQNFDSPLKSSSIIDFWLRWHMTLTRFLTAYIFNPLTLWLTRRRLAKGRSLLSARNATIGAFIYLLMVPLLATMFISGLWRGAGYGFIFWGLLHGFYLTVNHAWRIVVRPRWPVRLNYDRLMKPVGFIDVRFRLRRDGVFSFVYDGIGYGLGEGHGWAEWGDPPGAGFRFSWLVRGLATYDGSGFPARGRPKPYDDGVLDHHTNVYRFGVSKYSSSVSQI